jgi:hypothetical protein
VGGVSDEEKKTETRFDGATIVFLERLAFLTLAEIFRLFLAFLSSAFFNVFDFSAFLALVDLFAAFLDLVDLFPVFLRMLNLSWSFPVVV